MHVPLAKAVLGTVAADRVPALAATGSVAIPMTRIRAAEVRFKVSND